jgi:hypothetical protein
VTGVDSGAELAPAITPVHQWTHTGTEVLILKCVPKDGRTHNGFQWPLTVGATAEAPDWKPVAECGHGLHGWPWGLYIGDGKDPDWMSTWLVFAAKPDDVVSIGGKVKARRGRIVFVGDWQSATNYVLAGQIAWVIHQTAEAPDCATGDQGASSATGACSLAGVTGFAGTVRGGPFGVIALAWWNKTQQRAEMCCARIGVGDGSDELLKANQWYRLDERGEFIAIDEAEPWRGSSFRGSSK